MLGAQRRVLGDEHQATLTSASNLAISLAHQGRHAEAMRIEREVLGARRRVLGEEHPDTLTSANNLALLLYDEGWHAEAEEMLRDALAARRRVLGSEHPITLSTLTSLESMRSEMRAMPPTKHGAKSASTLSPTALVEARAGAEEAGLLAMLEREKVRSDSESKGKANGNLRCGEQKRRTFAPRVKTQKDKKVDNNKAMLSPTALAEEEARARAAEAELLAMLDLEEPPAGMGGVSGKARGKAKGQASKAKCIEPK